jgi:acyl-CoA synthetase (AMP-forming)/AMP-acid ligase II
LIDRVRGVPGDAVALVDSESGESLTYAALLARCDEAARRLREASPGPGLAVLAMDGSVASVVLALACLVAGVPVVLLEPQSAGLERLAEVYAPALLLLPETLPAPGGGSHAAGAEQGYRLWRGSASESAPHPDLALLLTTSGSTGSPKLVRLTRRNLEANATSIAQYLELGPGERAIASLPLHYSYGLSVLNSHLVSGGTLVLTPHSFMRPEFWAVVREHGCTSFAGVPFMYETLHRLRHDPRRHPSLRTYTQAGGALRADLAAHFAQVTAAAGARMVVMYGQTEATARISYVPPERLAAKAGSIGIAIPGGRLHLEPVAGLAGSAEIVYEGPNVMMGYAESPRDLALGDVLGGVLRTGDLGEVDADGYYRVTGRLKRFAKLFGRRVSLEDVEQEIERVFNVPTAAFDRGDRLAVMVACEDAAVSASARAHVARMVGVPLSVVELHARATLPRTATGKKDYRAAEASL